MPGWCSISAQPIDNHLTSPEEDVMNYNTACKLLDQAEAEFRVESAEIEHMASPLQPLRDDVGEMNSSGQHPADLASETVEREIAFGLLADADAVLVEIEAARGRLSAGVYGRCQTCGHDIDPERLAAVPWARRCAPDENHVESTWRETHVVAAPTWRADWAEPEPPDDDSGWDPEEEILEQSSEELALHDVSPRRGSSDIPPTSAATFRGSRVDRATLAGARRTPSGR
jgi:RNA polymerase-binding transcription factor DksA